MRFIQFLKEAAATSTAVSVSFRFSVPETARILAHYDDIDLPAVLNEIGQRLEDVVGEPLMVRKKSSFRAKNKWVVEPADEGTEGFDVDVISPLVPVGQATGFIDSVSKWISSNGLRRADNFMQAAISVKGIEQSLDLIKLLFLLNPSAAKRVVNRAIGKYPQPRLEVLTHKLKLSGRIPETYHDLHDAALAYLASKDVNKISVGNVTDGVIEFDLTGLETPSDAKTRINQLVNAIEKACDPTAWKSDYVKALIDASRGAEPDRDERIYRKADDLPPALSRLARLDTGIASSWFDIEEGSTHSSMKEEAVKLAADALATVSQHHQSLDRQEIQFLRRLLDREGVTSADADAFLKNSPSVRLKFQKEFSR